MYDIDVKIILFIYIQQLVQISTCLHGPGQDLSILYTEN